MSGIQNRRLLENWEEPHQVAKQANVLHVSMQTDHEIMLHALLKHAERLSPGKVTHDIETVEVKPVGHIDWLASGFCKALKQLVGVLYDAGFVLAKSWGVLAGVY